MHGGEVVVTVLDTDNLTGNLTCRIICGTCSGDESIGIACFHHHHTEIVAVKHLIKGAFKVFALTLTFGGEHISVTLTAGSFTVVTEVNDLYTVDIYAETLRTFADHLLVAEQDRYAETVSSSDSSGTKHIVGVCFGKYHTLGIGAGSFIKTAGKLTVIALKQTELLIVGFPVGNRTAGNTTLHSTLSHGRRN